MNKHTIVIAGGTGLIGRRLSARFLKEGHTVHILSRKRRESNDPRLKYFLWDTASRTMDSDAWTGATDLVQLAGAPIAEHKWTEVYKKILISSRVDSTRTLVEDLDRLNLHLNHIYCASAIGFYGNRPSDEILTEESSSGKGFVSELVRDWEVAGRLLSDFAQEHTIMRIGLVLDREDGFLQKFTPGLRFLTAPYFGSGAEYFSWIHSNDIVNYVSWSLDRPLADTTNLVAPETVSAKRFAQVLAQVSSWPAVAVPVPKLGIKLAFGQRSEVILMGNNVRPTVLQKESYPYSFPELEPALRDLI